MALSSWNGAAAMLSIPRAAIDAADLETHAGWPWPEWWSEGIQNTEAGVS